MNHQIDLIVPKALAVLTEALNADHEGKDAPIRLKEKADLSLKVMHLGGIGAQADSDARHALTTDAILQITARARQLGILVATNKIEDAPFSEVTE